MDLQPADLDYIRALVRERSAIVLDEDKGYLVEARLTPLVRELGVRDLSELVRRLRAAEPALRARVVEAMTTNETSFFRDQHPFDVLRTQLLPGLIERRRPERTLRIWSAACSTGQEPYSIAILLRESFPELAAWQVGIHASDLSSEVLRRARDGSYTAFEVRRGLSPAQLATCFTESGGEWRVASSLRAAVDFFPINLIEPWPTLPRMDVIFLRNVMVYFDVATKRAILANMRRVLRPDGYLLLGGAETTLNLDDSFERVPGVERASCYRLREGEGR